MTNILVIDAAGDTCQTAQSALREAGWDVTTAGEPSEAQVAHADAIVVSAEAPGVSEVLQNLMGDRRDDTPVVLLTDFDHSGWDRTFSSSEALGVDALLDLPVDANALVKRLKGILDARREVALPAEPQMEAILDRAIANEEAAAAFYRRAAEHVSDPTTREALQDLMRQEKEHKEYIERFRSGEQSLPEKAPPSGSLVEKFGTPDFSADLSPQDAFLLAARKEQMAVEFYENWAQLYPEGPERQLLEGLAEVELKHKARVEDMFTNAAFPEEW